MPVKAAGAAAAQSYFIERRAARQQRRAERKQSKQEQPAPATEAAPVAKPAEAPKPESKNFIGNTAGANVVNIAVQGGRGGDKLAVFASGEGPKPPAKVDAATSEKKDDSTVAKVDTVA